MAQFPVNPQPPVPSIADQINQLYGQPDTTLDDIIAQISQQASKAQELSDAAQGQLRGAIMQPTPQVPAAAQSLLAGMGRAAESFTGQKGAFAFGQNLIGEQNQNLMERRKQSIQELEQSYRDAAGRAEKMQDFSTSLKFKAKADRELNRLHALTEGALKGQEQTFVAGQNELNRKSDEKIRFGVANIEAAGMRDRALIEAKTRIDIVRDMPPELKATIEPMAEHMKQLSQAIGTVMSNPKMKDSDRKKRLDALHGELQSEGEAYQQALQSFYQNTPAGKTGEAAKTPLGVIMQRARDAGATTFEDFRKLAYSSSSSAILHGYDIKSALAAAAVDAPGAGFPSKQTLDYNVKRYRDLTTGALRFSSIRKNADTINTLAANLKRWGFDVATAEELQAKPSFEIPGTEVTAPRK